MTAFLDEAVIEVKGGSGGNGIVSFLRTRRQPRGGPNGGSGGDGGSVYARSDQSLSSLVDYVAPRRYEAGRGNHGKGKLQNGANGDDLWLRMPIGTDIIDEASGDLHVSLSTDGQEALLAKGGIGGRGNYTFKSSTNRAPHEATSGQLGDVRVFRLSLRLLADVGLLGLPNAGKSSFLNAVSNTASPIGAYPFTTLRPHLGVVHLSNYAQLVIADIPGIMHGAAQGVGMGSRFLRHISRTKLLLHMVDCSCGETGQISQQIKTIDQELAQASNAELKHKPQVLVFTKSDLLSKDTLNILQRRYQNNSTYLAVHAISSDTRFGIAKLLESLQHTLATKVN